jgi:hypothetical protein
MVEQHSAKSLVAADVLSARNMRGTMAKKQTRDRDKPTRRKPREQPELNRKTLHLLDDKFIYGVKKKDTYADGGNLYLQVGIGGSAKSWMFIYGAVRLLGEDSYTPFIAALEEAGQKIPPTAPDRIPALFKTANSIAKEYAAADEAYKQAVKAHEHAADAKRQGLLHVPVPAPGATAQNSADRGRREVRCRPPQEICRTRLARRRAPGCGPQKGR